MRGWMPKEASVQEIITGKIPEMWEEQEKMLMFASNLPII
jgi:hypothetical protein